jgi:hypothetical protein
VDFDTMGEELLGDDVLGFDTVGARRVMQAVARAARGRSMRLPPKAPWRQTQLAPGVQSPGQGLIPLPLVPDAAGGVFAAATTLINFQARPQKPYRPERLLATVRRTGAAGTIIFCDTMFVGTDLQTAEVGAFDIENFGPTAFGVRLSLKPCEPGILVRLALRAAPAPAGADTVAVGLMFLGQYIG